MGDISREVVPSQGEEAVGEGRKVDGSREVLDGRAEREVRDRQAPVAPEPLLGDRFGGAVPEVARVSGTRDQDEWEPVDDDGEGLDAGEGEVEASMGAPVDEREIEEGFEEVEPPEPEARADAGAPADDDDDDPAGENTLEEPSGEAVAEPVGDADVGADVAPGEAEEPSATTATDAAPAPEGPARDEQAETAGATAAAEHEGEQADENEEGDEESAASNRARSAPPLPDVPPIEGIDHLSRVLLTLLLAAREGASMLRLAQSCDVSQKAVAEGLDHLAALLADQGLPLELARSGEHVRLLSAPETFPYLQRLRGVKKTERLSQAALETLAVIAYRQPVIRAEIEAIRGVKAGPILRTLLDHKLVAVTGRADVPGRPLQYGTTQEFLERFGLSSLKDLPSVKEFKQLG